MRRGLLPTGSSRSDGAAPTEVGFSDEFRVQDNSRHGLTLWAGLFGQGPDLTNSVIEHGSKTTARLLERMGRNLRPSA